MEDISILIGLGGVGVVTGLAEVAKRMLDLTPEVERRVMPALALVLGVGFNALVTLALGQEQNWPIIVVFGIIAGLASSGAYSGGKATVGR